jgi:hypothetical protein
MDRDVLVNENRQRGPLPSLQFDDVAVRIFEVERLTDTVCAVLVFDVPPQLGALLDQFCRECLHVVAPDRKAEVVNAFLAFARGGAAALQQINQMLAELHLDQRHLLRHGGYGTPHWLDALT